MLSWYVMRSKPNKEELLRQQLQLREVETYYPSIKVSPVNPRSLKVKPYFPGYLFIRVDLDIHGSSLQWIPGAMNLVSFGSEFATVGNELLLEIRRKVDQINAANGELLESLKHGDIVAIQSGPFAGYRAIFDARLTGQERIRVLLQLLHDRQVGVELSVTQIERFREYQYPSQPI
jgi:transcription antitermination factor NusG